MLATTITSALAVLLALYGAQRAVAVVVVLLAKRPAPFAPLTGSESDLPAVTVQLPLFNEPAVCARIVDAAVALRWPRDRLEIQILDDSTDDTSAIVAERAAAARAAGVDVVHLRRPRRTGFKAGALAHGLARAKGELVAVFDADFCPADDFLLRAVPPFADGADVVQARWGHLNRDASWLTRAQAVFLDAHFSLEHRARAATGRFFPFNGTAGIWRKQAIVDAGGWDSRTLTEDLDLSLRAWAGGARFVYLDDVEVLAELPAAVNAWKLQQHRWAKGSMQTLTARLSTVVHAQRSLAARVDAGLRLTQNLTFLLLLLLCALLPAAALERADAGARSFVDVTALGLGTLPVLWGFVVACRSRGRRLRDVVVDVPLALVAGAGLAVNNGRAVLEGLLSTTPSIFERTPKSGDGNRAQGRSTVTAGFPRQRGATRSAQWNRSALRSPPLTFVELGLGLLHVVTAGFLLLHGHADLTPFLWLCGGGLLLTGVRSLREAGGEGSHDGAADDDEAGPERLLPHASRMPGEVRLVQEREERRESPQPAPQRA
ncbi:MAG: glycosyltransferase [Deltaproteobacteria bacterium]|nr:glycosyltransferase [Deltaproteobacteria bacterium]